VKCRFCDDAIDPRRGELGYDYCTSPECQQRGLKRLELARVAVNKAADQFVPAEDAVRRVSTVRYTIEDVDESPSSPSRSPRRKVRTAPSTLEKLRAAERELDAKLTSSYDRFCRGDITAAEMKAEQSELIAAFNNRVMADNIRYRSLLRRQVS
jgi:hypothetical protein